jgi:hypothetical protein
MNFTLSKDDHTVTTESAVEAQNLIARGYAEVQEAPEEEAPQVQEAPKASTRKTSN